MDIASSIQTLTDALKSASPSAKSILSNSIDDLKNSLAASKSSFSSPNILQDGSLGSTLTDVVASKKVAEENFKTLTKNLSNTTKIEAIKPPTSFVSSTSQQLIDGVNLPSFSSVISPENFTSSELTKLSQLSGVSEFTSESLTETIKDQLVSAQGQFASQAEVMKDAITDSDKGILSGLSSIGNSQIVQDTKSLASKAFDSLPSGMQSTISQISSLTTSQLSRKLSTITSKISSISNVGSALGSIVGLGGDYPEVTNLSGQPISGLAGKDMSYSEINGLYKDARQICDNVDLLDMLEYGNLKDVFDILVNAALNGGLASLVRQLMNCSAFADKRTGYIMQGNVGTVASRGDIFTLNAIQDYVGSSGMPNPLGTARTVAANMDYSPESASALQTFLSSNGLSESDLVQDSNSGYPSTISSQQVTYLSAKSPKYSESILSKDLVNTAMTFLTSFS